MILVYFWLVLKVSQRGLQYESIPFRLIESQLWLSGRWFIARCLLKMIWWKQFIFIITQAWSYCWFCHWINVNIWMYICFLWLYIMTRFWLWLSSYSNHRYLAYLLMFCLSITAIKAVLSSETEGKASAATNGGLRGKLNKVVLAYSGGLDTSVIVPWLRCGPCFYVL